MKKHNRVWLILFPLMLVLLLGMFAIGAAADTTEAVTVDINKFNLSFKDSIYIKYAVKLDGVDANTLTQDEFQLLFWTEPQTVYDKTTAESYAVCTSYTTIDGERNYVFVYDKFVAKNMADVLYSRVYVNVDGTVYYSDVEKYSILQYAYTMMGKLDEAASSDANLRQLMADMLTYGASAQKYLGYKTDRLATFDYYQIKVNGGTLTSDGTTQGLYLENETVEITAPEKDANGLPFAYWANSAGASVSEERTYTVTVGTANETYTAVYSATPVYTITVVNGTLSGGATSGSFLEGFTVTMTAEQTLANGYMFDHWENSAGQSVGTELTLTATVTDTEIYTAVYVESIYSQGLKFTSKGGGTCYVSGIGTCTDTDIIIPSVSPDGYTVTSIGDDAFDNCKSLTSITIPNSVTSIGDFAFWNCTSLTSITIPDSVTSIGDYAFRGCTSLASITVDENNANYQSIDANLYTKDGTMLIQYAVGKKEKSFIVPDNVTCIGQEAFYRCASLSSITIPDSVTRIDEYAFSGCTSLTSITLPDSVTSIGSGAFYSCTSLTSITIPDSVTFIGESAFDNCKSLTSVYITDIEAWCKIIFGYFFSNPLCYGSALYLNDELVTDLVIPDGVTSIGSYAFYGYKSLTSITIPDSVTSIGSWAFCNCTNLTSITIPSSVTSIGNYAFQYCTSLKTVYYGGTASDWSAISIDSSNIYLTNATRYYYSEAKPTDTANLYWHYDENGNPVAW